MTVHKPSSASDRAAQSQLRAYARSNYGRNALDSALGFDSTPGIGARAYRSHRLDDLPRSIRDQAIPQSLGEPSRFARAWSMQEALSEEGAAKVNEFLEPLGRKEHEPARLDPEVAAPLASIATLLEKYKHRTLPKLVTVTDDGVHVHTSHLDEREGRECVEKITKHEQAHLCENGHYTLENGWCHRCREADRNPPSRLREEEALTFLRAPATATWPDNTDGETRAFDVRERARETDDTHVTVGDHPPERRVRW